MYFKATVSAICHSVLTVLLVTSVLCNLLTCFYCTFYEQIKWTDSQLSLSSRVVKIVVVVVVVVVHNLAVTFGRAYYSVARNVLVCLGTALYEAD